ncbi:MAG: lgt 2 [Verrucomicrobiales bacterium]|nr:lgt 2 [Verrucomicrobiales bacterium]
MHPYIWTHPYIGSYSFFLLLGFLAAYFLARPRAKIFGIEPRHIDNLTLLLLCLCPIGARFFSRIFDYSPALPVIEWFKVWKGGGLVFYGGLLFGALIFWVYSAFQKIPFRSFMDLLAPSLAVGLGFGRVGCFMAGCCWGDVCVDHSSLVSLDAPTISQIQTFPRLSPAHFSLAVQFPKGAGAFEQHQSLNLLNEGSVSSLPVHPTQIYEAFGAFLIAFALLLPWFQKKPLGSRFCFFVMAYGVLRFGVEFFRADTRPDLAGFSISQLISLAAGLAGLAFWKSFQHDAEPSNPTTPTSVPVTG